MTKKNIYVWACDYSENTGEGRLARLFIKKYNFQKKYNFFFNQKKILKFRYISVFAGIFYCWSKFLKNQKVIYLNYLPFWNFIIFLLLPPNTILGPITGGANFDQSNTFQFFVRKKIFPIFYMISEKIVLFRNFKLVFSTILLKKYLSEKTIKKSKFDFVLNYYFKNKKKVKKKYDFVIYYKNHINKKNLFPLNFIKKLIIQNFSIIVVGDKLNLRNVKNAGFINNNSTKLIQSQSRYTIVSEENIYSLFTLECLSNNLKILADIKLKKQIYFKKNFFYFIDYKKCNNFLFLKKN